MPEVNLIQSEADALIAMEKHKADELDYDFPVVGGSISIPLVSPDKRELFFLDIGRGRIDLKKGTYQNRACQIVVLVRLDFGGAPHRNPDGIEVPCPHLHLYREGFGDKWAIPAPNDKFPKIVDLGQTLADFMQYCNITRTPNIRRELFS